MATVARDSSNCNAAVIEFSSWTVKLRAMQQPPIICEQFPETHRSLRVAVVTETYPPEINGVAITIERMVEGLRARDHEIQLVRPRRNRHEPAAGEPRFEEVLRKGLTIPRSEHMKIGLPAKQALIRRWSRNRPDIVHIVTEGPLGLSALAAALKLRIPCCSDFHANFHSYTKHYGIGWLRKPVAGYLRRFHNKAHCTLVPTASMRAELENHGYLNLRVVPRGVDTNLFRPARRHEALRQSWGVTPEQPVALYVGRLAPEKNLAALISAYAAMRKAEPGVRLVLVGDGPERANLQAQHPDVVFAGMQSGEALAAHYASGDIFLFPSTTESFGNVTLEALASGLAVVAYDYAAAAEYIRHGENGLLAAFGKDREFVGLALRLACNLPRAHALGAAAANSARSLDWSLVHAGFEYALREVIAAQFGHEADEARLSA
jgi:glycosyltransferase involved in cell wall biosynthesis